MRRVILGLVLLAFGSTATLHAQVKRKQQIKTRKPLLQQSLQTGVSDTVVLRSSTANQAYGSRSFYIADPTIRMLNQKARGKNVQISSSGVVGVPNGTYGFADGKLLLRQTTAPSSGTLYGSGAVGTGTTLMGVGAGANTPGLNGKNPYAGPWFWGSKLPLRNLPASDSISRKK